MAFAHTAILTIDKTKCGSVDSSNFPVLVFGTYAGAAGAPDFRTVANGGYMQSANAYDLQFFTDSGKTSRIAAERVYYNASTGQIEVHFKAGTLSVSANTIIYAGYSDSGISTDPNSDATYGKTSVWDSNYKAVYHLGDGSTVSLSDSTSNAYTLTNSNSTPAATGQIKGGVTFDGTTHRYRLSNSSLAITADSSITISFWQNFLSSNYSGSQSSFSIGGSDNPHRIQLHGPWSDGNLYWDYGDSTAGGRVSTSYASYDDMWSLVSCVFDAPSDLHRIYVNGSAAASSTNSFSPGTTQTGLDIGSWSVIDFFTITTMDEFRVSTVARSASWHTAEYNNQSSPSTFYTFAEVVAGSSVKTYDGLAVASVKTVDGLAIASVKTRNGLA